MGWNFDPDGIHQNQSGEINALTEKTTPAVDDLLLIEDSADSNAKKKVKLSNLGGGASELGDLSDVDTSGVTDGQVLKYDNDTSTWVPAADDTGSGSLPTATTKGDLAVYDGSNWVILPAGTNDHVLTADSGETAGVKWGAGGGGGDTVTPLEPDDISDLEGWWAADQIVGLSDNDPVSSWSDLSGNSKHFVQANAGLQPTYQTNEVNSLPVVRFDATNDGMTGGPTLANPFSIFYVARTAATGGNRRAIQGGVNNWILGPYGNFWQWYSGAFATSVGGVDSTVVIHGVTQTASTGYHFLRRTHPYPVPSLVFQARSSPGAIGAMCLGASGAFAEPYNGDFCEIVAYSRALTYDEGAGLVAHLADKWGVG